MVNSSIRTEAVISHINNHPDYKFIYVSPHKSERGLIVTGCKDRNFQTPENSGDGKLSNLHELLENQDNIVCTDQLLKYFNDQTLEIIKGKNYKLILDEGYSVIEPVRIHKDDFNLLLRSNIISNEDGIIKWLDKEYVGKFRHFKQIANRGHLYFEDGCLFWKLPIETLMAFKDVIILACMFDYQIQRYYFELNNIDIRNISIEELSGTTILHERSEYLKEAVGKIHILDNEKINSVGYGKHALSSNWFKREFDKKGKPNIIQLQNNISNVFRYHFKAKSDTCMWTTFKQSIEKLSSSGYTKGFVPYNSRDTIKYRNKSHLAYCKNVFLDSFTKNYFIKYQINMDEDKYALSQIVPWIFQSPICDGQDVWIYIPSSRMRNLLTNWIMSNIQNK